MSPKCELVCCVWTANASQRMTEPVEANASLPERAGGLRLISSRTCTLGSSEPAKVATSVLITRRRGRDLRGKKQPAVQESCLSSRWLTSVPSVLAGIAFSAP